MFIVVKCVDECGSVDLAARLFLGRPKTLVRAVLRLTFVVACVSAFILTSPLVTMMIPVVQSWCARIGRSPKELMMPLSFAAIIGGTVTVIGAPVNLLLNGLLKEQNAALVRSFLAPPSCRHFPLAPSLVCLAVVLPLPLSPSALPSPR